jgi:hypothetical protein
MTSFISLSTSSSLGFGIRSFTSTDHELGMKSFEKKKELSSFISLSSASTDSENRNGIKRFEKERKEFSNGKKWFSRLISPFVKQVSPYLKIEMIDNWGSTDI